MDPCLRQGRLYKNGRFWVRFLIHFNSNKNISLSLYIYLYLCNKHRGARDSVRSDVQVEHQRLATGPPSAQRKTFKLD